MAAMTESVQIGALVRLTQAPGDYVINFPVQFRPTGSQGKLLVTAGALHVLLERD